MEMKKAPREEQLVTDPNVIGKYLIDLTESMELIDSSAESKNGPYTHLKSALNERIIGQSDAIDSLVDTLNQEEFRDPTKPIGTFMFLGPTGVGKSQTAKEVARLLHDGSDKAFININCAQLKSSGDVTALQGAPPGYIGYDQKSMLDEEAINQPRSVILFDEIEKAHPAFHDFLMQILDEGEISILNSGNKLSIRDSLVILTSNAGSSEINKLANKNKRSLGFSSIDQEGNADIPKSRLTDAAFRALEKEFKPEFLGRIENKVLFTHLTDEQHSLALDQYIKEMNLRDGYIKRGVSLSASPELRDYIVQSCPRRQVGGFREVRASFSRTIEREFQSHLLSGNIPNHSIVYAVPASEQTKERNPGAIADFRLHRLAA